MSSTSGPSSGSSSGRQPEGERETGGSPTTTRTRWSREPRPPSPAATERRVGWRKLTFLPAALVAVLLATWLWFRQADLDALSENALSDGQVTKALWQHVQLTVISTFFVLIIAIPLGVLLTRGMFRRPRRWRWRSPTWARRPRRSACWRCW